MACGAVHRPQSVDRAPGPLVGEAAVVIEAAAAVAHERGKREDQTAALGVGYQCLEIDVIEFETLITSAKDLLQLPQCRRPAPRLHYNCPRFAPLQG